MKKIKFWILINFWAQADEISQNLTASAEWTDWTECSKNCGDGLRTRSHKICESECIIEEEKCNTQTCGKS